MKLNEQMNGNAKLWKLEGPLTILEVTEAKATFLAMRPTIKDNLDLTSITACDAAGLQLLCSWLALPGLKEHSEKISWPTCVKTCADTLGVALPGMK